MSSASNQTNSPAAAPSFEWLRSRSIPALNIQVEEYRHKKTGAMHYHLAADNDENVFLVALRTVPMDSRGVAHILEHTALCGSQHYPVRDPFFMMIRRSLNTFMNAFTSSDWTAYPFASENRKDFNNLLDVYLDAVFFSRLDALDFAQEGHRVEFAEPANPESELVFKGVVFNEMKGVMSSPTNVLWHTLAKYLFPTTTYHYNSGGEPEQIPDLSHDDLLAFYKTHYHPSNAIFMTYGNIPASQHQVRFEERALQHFDHSPVHIGVGDEARYFAPLKVEECYAVEDPNALANKTHIVMSWLLGPSTDLEAQMRAQLLSGVLLDDGASPLRHALDMTELGTPSPLCGLEDSSREMSFICGLEGSEPEHAAAAEALVLEVLQRIAAEGVPQARIEAVLHQLELHQREISGDGYPYGLQLILHGLSAATHRGDVVALLDLEPVLAKLREDIKDPQFIQKLVQELLLNNPHQVRLTLRPDPQLGAHRDAAEKRRLAKLKARLSPEDKATIVSRAAELAARQGQEDDPDILPKVGLEDVPADIKTPRAATHDIAGQRLSAYTQGTNGLVYQQILARLPALDEQQLSLLPQFANCFTEVGCGGRDYLATQAWQSSVSGGVSAGSSMRCAVNDTGKLAGYFALSGKALTPNQAALTELLHSTFTQVSFSEHARLQEIIAQERAHREQSVTGNGHSLAMLAAASGFNPGAGLAHRWQGLQGIKHIKQLDQDISTAEGVATLAGHFAQLHQGLLSAERQYLVIGEADNNAQAVELLSQQWQAQPTANQQAALELVQAKGQPVRQAWTTNTTVNFCAKAYATVAYDHADAPVLSVLGGFLRNGYLHRTIREQGGAYGGGAGHDNDNGVFRFYSYRDPRLSATLADFDRALAWLQSDKHPWRLVEEAILGVVGALDKPGSPAGEARKAFYNQIYGRDPAVRMRFREGVLAVTLADLQRVAEQYLQPAQAGIAVITSAGRHSELQGLEVISL